MKAQPLPVPILWHPNQTRHEFRTVEGAPMWWKAEFVPEEVKAFVAENIWPEFSSCLNGGWFWPGCILHGGMAAYKTCAAIYMAMLAANLPRPQWRAAKFMTASHLVNYCKEGWGDGGSYLERVATLVKPEVLIVDDAGAFAFQTVAERGIFYDVLVGRESRCRQTILTGNFDLDTQAGRDEFYACVGLRVARRFEGCTFHCGVE